MTWQQISCHTTRVYQEAVSELMEDAGAASVTLQDAADQPVLEPLPGETPLWDQLIVTGLFPAQDDLTALLLLLESRRQDWSVTQVRLEPLEDRPWVREWMDNFKPMQFGQRLWIYPSWCEAPDDDSVKILLDPGLAFGTGNHPTTALCLEWLDGEAIAGKAVLDYGCGSGVLAIAAAKLGAARVVATDIDPQALEATRNNSVQNAVPDGLIHTCLPENLQPALFDVVMANILAGPLMKLAPDLLSYLKPGGRLVLSGVLSEQAEQVLTTYQAALAAPKLTELEGWVCISGTAK